MPPRAILGLHHPKTLRAPSRPRSGCDVFAPRKMAFMGFSSSSPSFFSPGLSCPRHSHYELCGGGCPPTCRGPAFSEDCGWAPCVEGCFCDPGFVLSGDECVPAGECGCEHRGRYYKKGAEFSPSCREKCRCGADGAAECEEVFCGVQEERREEEGHPGGHPAASGRLAVWGDPRGVTFDGRAFELRGSCAYVLARLCAPRRGLAEFAVLLEHEARGRGGGALVKKVAVTVHGHTVGVERGRRWEATVSPGGARGRDG